MADERVGAPVLSPDGKRVVFSVTEPAYDDKQVSDLWVVRGRRQRAAAPPHQHQRS